MRWLLIGIVVSHVALWTGVAIHPQWLDGYQPPLDRLRCYAEPSTTYRDGELGYRVPQRRDYAGRLHCWPRDGCMVDASNGDARCWRVVKVTPQ